MADSLSLNDAPAPLQGPPLRSGKPRKRPFKPRRSNPSPPELIRTAKAHLRFTPEVLAFIEGYASHTGMGVSLLIYQAVAFHASAARYARPAPPWDPKAVPPAPMLPGLTATGPDPPGRAR